MLRPGGRLGVSDVDRRSTTPTRTSGRRPNRRSAAPTGTVTARQYRDQLLAAGFTRVEHHAHGRRQRRPVLGDHPGRPARRPARRAHPADAGRRRQTGPGDLPGRARHSGRPASRPPPRPGRRSTPRSCRCTVTWPPTPPPGRYSAGSPPQRYRAGACTRESSSTACTSTPARHGGGIGAALLAALTGSAEAAGIWTIQSGVFPENTASLRLHERAGFRVVGTRERIGCHHGRWRDTVLIERRSAAVGVS